jgi:hypothetical protein
MYGAIPAIPRIKFSLNNFHPPFTRFLFSFVSLLKGEIERMSKIGDSIIHLS